MDRNERARRVGFILVALLAAYYIRYVDVDIWGVFEYGIRGEYNRIVKIITRTEEPHTYPISYDRFMLEQDVLGSRVIAYQDGKLEAVLLDHVTKYEYTYSLIRPVNDYGCALIVKENNAVILYLADRPPEGLHAV